MVSCSIFPGGDWGGHVPACILYCSYVKTFRRKQYEYIYTSTEEKSPKGKYRNMFTECSSQNRHLNNLGKCCGSVLWQVAALLNTICSQSLNQKLPLKISSCIQFSKLSCHIPADLRMRIGHFFSGRLSALEWGVTLSRTIVVSPAHSSP